MLRAAVQSARDGCLLLGVSVLTSLDAPAVASIWGRTDAVQVDSEVVRLARLAADAGLGGFVCSGHEIAPVRKAVGNALRLVVPGIRFSDSAGNDQARIVTPAAAAKAGVDYIVVGRAVTASSDPAAAMNRLKSELAAVLNK
jgi:orotidine-5'-phosphate decarboxylase